MPGTEKKSGRLFSKVAFAINEIGPTSFEKHLDTIISSKKLKGSNTSASAIKLDEQVECIILVVAKTLALSPHEIRLGSNEASRFALNMIYYLIKTKVFPVWPHKKIAIYFNRTSHSVVSRGLSDIYGLNPNNKFDKAKIEQLKSIEAMIQKRKSFQS